MDIVYSYKHDAKAWADWPALFYSIRTMKRNYSNIGSVYVVGDIEPLMLAGIGGVKVIDIRSEQAGSNVFKKASDIVSKVLFACLHGGVSENFIWLCDDFFAVSKIEDSDFDAAYYNGMLRETGTKFNRYQSFQALLKRTDLILGGGLDFCCHHPIKINKNLFQKMCERYGFEVQLESMYLNTNEADKIRKLTDDFSMVFRKDDRRKIKKETKFVSYVDDEPPEYLKKIIKVSAGCDK